MNYHCPRPPKQRAFDTSLLMWRRRFLSGTAFSPASLFASGEDGGWYDPSDLTTLFQEITGASATTPAGVGDPVGTILDKSGNGNHLVAPALIQRPVLQTEGGRYYLDFDGVDDLLETPTYTGQANPSSLFTAFNPGTGTNFILHRSGDNTGFIFIADDFSGTTGVFALCGTPTTRLNGEDFSPSTRGVAHAATTNATNVIGFESLDLTDAVFSKIGVSNYSGIWLLEGKWYGTVLIDRALTTAERENLEIFLANKSGATLA